MGISGGEQASLQNRLQECVALIGLPAVVGLSDFAKHGFIDVRSKQRPERILVGMQRRQQLFRHGRGTSSLSRCYIIAVEMRTPIFLLLTAAAFAQTPRAPKPLKSPEVHPDRSVTFRFRAPNAKEVLLSRSGAKRAPMEKDDQGVWTITTEPLDPDFYSYTFVADGVTLLDPYNSHVVPNLLNMSSAVHVPGPPSLPWEINNVPHGEIHHHFYRSEIVGDNRDFYVYTPPGYDPTAKQLYPVLYLLHGMSDDASAWTAVGQANVILDNLIAQGKSKSMVIVMPLGYGAPEIVSRGPRANRTPDLGQRNREKFRDALFAEVIPEVERKYRV